MNSTKALKFNLDAAPSQAQLDAERQRLVQERVAANRVGVAAFVALIILAGLFFYVGHAARPDTLALGGVVFGLFFAFMQLSRSSVKYEETRSRLEALDPVNEHPEACPEALALVQAHGFLREYQHQVVEQCRPLVMGELVAMRIWVHRLEQKRQSGESQARNHEACRALGMPV